MAAAPDVPELYKAEERDEHFRKIRLSLPNSKDTEILLRELVDFLNTMSYTDVGFEIQILPNGSIRVDLEYRLSEASDNSATILDNLDILTS